MSKWNVGDILRIRPYDDSPIWFNDDFICYVIGKRNMYKKIDKTIIVRYEIKILKNNKKDGTFKTYKWFEEGSYMDKHIEKISRKEMNALLL